MMKPDGKEYGKSDWDQLFDVIALQGNVGQALNALRRLIAEWPLVDAAIYRQRLDAIEADYQRMLDIMQKGYADPHRVKFYEQLLHRIATLAADCRLTMLCRNRRSLADAVKKRPTWAEDREQQRSLLETFVQNVAMLSLQTGEGEETSQRRAQLYADHYRHLEAFFNTLLTARQWTEADGEFYTELLSSPTIDTVDACLLVSAVMLSAMTEPDMLKTIALYDIYCQATDEAVRQRALVGMAFSLPQIGTCPARLNGGRLKERLLNDSTIARQLLELQEQILLCMDADRDNETLQHDILPTIIKNQNFRITPTGVEEIEEDELQDILHPHAEDEAMEELEQSIKRMMEMQRGGSDIYFGGFSQMKRFSFFYTLINWFLPFTVDHPALAHVVRKLRDSRFLTILFESGPFCDSDKYSFALAMSSVLDKLPDNVREMMNSEEALGPVADTSEQQSPAYIRRMYLQDLYRFFRLYSQKEDFTTPFGNIYSQGFFSCNSLFHDLFVGDIALSLGRFLLKRKQYALLFEVIDEYRGADEEDDLEWNMLDGMASLRTGENHHAMVCFNTILKEQPNNEQALKGLAQASFLFAEYEQAADAYGKLLQMNPDTLSYQVNYCISEINNGHAAESVTTLYRLYYDYSENAGVVRALAWGLLAQGSIQQALHLYEELLGENADDDAVGDAMSQPSDFLNAGYCHWLLNNVEKAIALFRHVLPQDEKSPMEFLLHAFEEDRFLLEQLGITHTDLLLMADLVSRKQ